MDVPRRIQTRLDDKEFKKEHLSEILSNCSMKSTKIFQSTALIMSL